MRTHFVSVLFAFLSLGTTACGGPGDAPPDAPGSDGGGIDARPTTDGGGSDVGPIDGGGADDGGTSDDGGTTDDAGGTGPTCTITAPLDGTEQAYDDDFTFVATASDPEDGALSGASVVWRSDLVTAPLGSGLSVTATLEPGTHTITCTATDADGNTGVGSIAVVSASPVVTINHPGDGETRPAVAPIPFVGLARDFEDGALTGASLVWTSSIDGEIGTGTTFSATLSAGTNVVTLTATDADGNTGTATVTLTITP